jgi:hypothetical protein
LESWQNMTGLSCGMPGIVTRVSVAVKIA